MTPCTVLYAPMSTVPLISESNTTGKTGQNTLQKSGSDENEFLAVWPVTQPPFLWPVKSQAYRADESVDINTVLVDGEEIVNVGYIANGEWLRYTVDVTYIGGTENATVVCVSRTGTVLLLVGLGPAIPLLLATFVQPRQAVQEPRQYPHRNQSPGLIPSASLCVPQERSLVDRGGCFYVSKSSFSSPPRHTK